ncbi:hypothetical protein JCM1841_004338 [Sporobolomyces salmonicolor]
MAIESGYLLSTLLSHPLPIPETAPLALSAFAAQHPVSRGDPGKLARDLQGRYKWIWGWEPEEEAQRAREVLEAELRRSA